MLDTVGMTPEEIAIANQQMEQQMANLESGATSIIIIILAIGFLIALGILILYLVALKRTIKRKKEEIKERKNNK